jgi:hypothetical protein
MPDDAAYWRGRMSVLMASESRFERATGRVLGDVGAVDDDLDLVGVGDPGLEP